MNHLDLAQAFIAVADCGSVQKAAQHLHQTDAAISRKITKLETHLGATLIKRERSGALLTDIGQRYYHQCKKALHEFALAETIVKEKQKEPEGVLRVVANQFYVNHFILPATKEFLKKHPKINLQIDVAEVLPDFKKTKMDILFGVGLKGSDDLVQKRVDQWRHILCASPRYLKQAGTPATTAELLKHDFIAHGSRNNPEIVSINEEHPVTMQPTLIINQTTCIIEAALNHLGIIWVPEPFVQPLLKQGKLIEILTKYNQKKLDIYLYYQYQKIVDAKIKAFVEHFS